MAEVTYGGVAPVDVPPVQNMVMSPFGASLRAAQSLVTPEAVDTGRGAAPSGRVGTSTAMPSVGMGSQLPGPSGNTGGVAPTGGAAPNGWLMKSLQAAQQAINAATAGQPPAGGAGGAGGGASPAPAAGYQTPDYWMGGDQINQNIDPYNPNSTTKPFGTADQKFVQWANPQGVDAAQKMLEKAGIKSSLNPTNTEFDPFGTTKQAQLNTGGGPLMNAGMVAALMNNPYYRDNPQLLAERLRAEANPNALGRPGESPAQTQQRLAAETPAPPVNQTPAAAPPRQSAPSMPRVPQSPAAILAGVGQPGARPQQPSWMTNWNRVRRPLGYTSWNRTVRPTGSAPSTQTSMGLPSRFNATGGNNNGLMMLLSLLMGR